MKHQPPENAFAVAHEDQVYLRVLTGAQQGAEIILNHANYVVGSGNGADIVLADGSLEPHHISLDVSEAGVIIAALDGEFSADSKTFRSGESFQLTGAAALRVGMVAIALGPPKTDWSALPVPDFGKPQDDRSEDSKPAADPAADEESPDNLVAAEETSDDSQATLPQMDSEQVEQTAEPLAMNSPVDEAPEEEQEERRSRGLPWIATVLLAAIIALFASSNWYFELRTTTGSTAISELVAPDPEALVAVAVGDLGLQHVRVEGTIDTGLSVTGIVDTYDQQNALKQSLKETGVQVTNRVRAVEQILDAVRVTLSANSWPEPNYDEHLSILHLGEGNIQVEGYLGPLIDKSQLHRRIEIDVPGMSGLEFTKSDALFWQSLLRDRIEQASLSDWLHVSIVGDKLRVDGELTASQAKLWRTVGEAFAIDSRGWPRVLIGVTALREPEPVEVIEPEPEPEPVVEAPVVTAPVVTAPAEPEIPRPNIEVIGVILTKEHGNIALLSNGESVHVGDHFESGAVIRRVDKNGITVDAGDKEYFFHVKERR